MSVDELLSFINQCDDLPPECFDGTWACTCESFLVPFFILSFTGIAVGVLTVVRMFGKNEDEKQ